MATPVVDGASEGIPIKNKQELRDGDCASPLRPPAVCRAGFFARRWGDSSRGSQSPNIFHTAQPTKASASSMAESESRARFGTMAGLLARSLDGRNPNSSRAVAATAGAAIPPLPAPSKQSDEAQGDYTARRIVAGSWTSPLNVTNEPAPFRALMPGACRPWGPNGTCQRL
jgi:hypothetical protein